MPNPDPPTASEELDASSDHLIQQASSEIDSDDPAKIADRLRLDQIEFPRFAHEIEHAIFRLAQLTDLGRHGR